MKAMILAAGYGTRLRPLTYERAKPSVPLFGVPLIRRICAKLNGFGVDQFRINLHHLPETIERVFDASSEHISFSYEPEILGTAGGLKANDTFFRDGTFLMVNGDVLFDLDLAGAIRFHRSSGAAATLVMVPQRPPFPHYQIKIAGDGGLLHFKGDWSGGEPLPETYVFTGIHILEPEILDAIPPGRYSEINDEVYPRLLAHDGRVKAFPAAGYWNDLGTPLSYLSAQRWLYGADSESGIRIGDKSVCAGELMGCSSVGNECRVEEGAVVSDSILWDNVVVKREITVDSCIVGSGVVLDRHVKSQVITTSGVKDIGHE